MKSKFQIGDRVAYAARFLKSIGAVTGDMPQARGKVSGVQPLGQNVLVSVEWDSGDFPGKVLQPNLAKVGPNRDFCNVD